jgi:para-aminobenzoate synthetase component 1
MTTPSVQEIPYSADSELLFARLRHLPGAVWLDSGKPRALQGRFDIISALPQAGIRCDRGIVTVDHGKGRQSTAKGDPFALAWQLLTDQGLVGDAFSHLPFTGGLMGYFSYDLGERLLGVQRGQPGSGPELHLGWYGWGIVVNHQASRSWLVSHPRCDRDSLLQVRHLLAAAPPETAADFALDSDFVPGIAKSDYLAALERIHHYIRSGDCYQVNFAIRHLASYRGDPWHAYRHIRRVSPSPYSAYLNWDGRALLCCSPERFLKVSVGQVETKPIKGTIGRGRTLEEDQDNAVALLNSSKDRAENLMIVDLLRNDLGRNCATGSVRVPKLFALESFANVHHLVSTITGTLAPGRTPLDLLRDAFPGGSITGAPKKRAVEIIASLETQPRGLYCGSIGYISATGRMDTNIAIRTLEASSGKIQCWGGGGIVADSGAETEYQEARHKVKNLLDAVGSFRG